MEESSISDLRNSSRRIGRFYPVLLDRDGNLIDGQHRLAADPDWPKIKLRHIGSEKERLLARLISNVCRRNVSAEEKTEMLDNLGMTYIKEGEKPGKLALRIAEETGMSYRWVMKYLPDHLKERPGAGGPSSHEMEIDRCNERNNLSRVALGKECRVAHRATLELSELLLPFRNESVVVKGYTNSDFVGLMLEKRVYEHFDRLAKLLDITAEMMIGNAMILILKKVESMTRSMNPVPVEGAVS